MVSGRWGWSWFSLQNCARYDFVWGVGTLGFLGGASGIFLFMTIICFIEAMDVVSLMLLRRYKHCNQVTSFSTSFKLYSKIQILIRVGNQFISIFIQTLIVMGVLLAACTGYVFVKLDGYLPTCLYLIMIPLFPIAIITDFLFFTMFSVPSENAMKFRQYWKGKLTKKLERLQLLSCAPIGYSFGFVDNCQRKSALSELDVEVNGVACLSLIQAN